MGTAGEDAKRRPEVVAVYYPHWHSYDHGSAWKGEGWTEWEGVKAAVPRFPGHQQPLKPTWGYFDESDPKWSAREIDLAADHGIDVFLFDWYWYSGVKNMEEALEQGFLKAANRDRMKFALMWANHDRRDQFCPDFGQGADRVAALAPLAARPGACAGLLRRALLPSAELLARGGAAVLQHLPGHGVRRSNWADRRRPRKLLQKMDERLRQAGLPPMHWNGMVADPKSAAILKEAGFSSTSRYNVNTTGKAGPDLTEQYEDLMQAHRDHWQKMTAESPLVNVPVVTTGWDVTPRCRQGRALAVPRGADEREARISLRSGRGRKHARAVRATAARCGSARGTGPASAVRRAHQRLERMDGGLFPVARRADGHRPRGGHSTDVRRPEPLRDRAPPTLRKHRSRNWYQIPGRRSYQLSRAAGRSDAAAAGRRRGDMHPATLVVVQTC